MKIFAKEQLSPHKYKTKEGYLICTDAILARTGKQTYRKSNFFPNAADADVDIEVDRPEKEVCDASAVASFENKPICIEHPDDDVTVDNYKNLAVGYVRDVKITELDGQKVMTGNLVFTDQSAIDLIESGQYNQLSCGYDCEVLDEDNPSMSHIRGNHVALCKEGRAGIAKIQDSTNDSVKLIKLAAPDIYIIYDETTKKYYFADRNHLNHRAEKSYNTREEAEEGWLAWKKAIRFEIFHKYDYFSQDSKAEDTKADRVYTILAKVHGQAKTLYVAGYDYSDVKESVLKYVDKNAEFDGRNPMSYTNRQEFEKTHSDVVKSIYDSKTEDAKRLQHDDDVIIVKCDGKEVYKGLADYFSGYHNDDFYGKLKWTGSEYELKDSEGKLWTLKVLDSQVKDSWEIKYEGRSWRCYHNGEEIEEFTDKEDAEHYVAQQKRHGKDSVKDSARTITVQCYIINSGQILTQERPGPVWPGIAVPGGHVKADETPLEACVREVREETGLEVRQLELFGTYNYECEEDGPSIAMLYTTHDFYGDLHQCDEGFNKWYDINEVLQSSKCAEGLQSNLAKLIHGVDINDSKAKDSYMNLPRRYEDEVKNSGFKYEINAHSIRVWGPRHTLENFKKEFDNDEFISYVEIKDSVKDANTKSNLINALDVLVTKFKLLKEGETWTGRKHFEFESKDVVQNFRTQMDLIDRVIERFDNAYHCVSTYNAVLKSDGHINIVIDVDDKHAHDSKKSATDAVKAVKLIRSVKVCNFQLKK